MLSTRYAHSARMSFPCTWPEPEDRVPLYIRDGTQFREAQHEQVLKHARSLVAERVRPDAPLLCMPEIKEFLWLTLAPRHRSTFAALLLDYRFRLINLWNCSRAPPQVCGSTGERSSEFCSSTTVPWWCSREMRRPALLSRPRPTSAITVSCERGWR